MRTSSVVAVVALLAVPMLLVPALASAQCLCSGRCYLDGSGQATCGFSGYTCHECWEAVDYCWETACYGASVQPAGSPKRAGLLLSTPARECAMKPPAPPASPALATTATRVTVLRARS